MAKKERAAPAKQKSCKPLAQTLPCVISCQKFPAQKSQSISEERGDVSGGAYRSEMFVGKERNVVSGRNRQG